MPDGVAVTGVAVISGLGATAAAHQRGMDAGQHGLRPLGELGEVAATFADLPGGWITPRSMLAGNRYGPATNLSLKLAKAAVADAGISAAALRDAWVFCGTSRGNLAGWLAPWPGRHGHRQMATSNSMHSEMAAAITIAMDIHGPFQVLSNGCAAGLDAVGFGYWAVASGMAPRALMVAADLPLVPQLLESYRQTGLLSHNGVNDPYGSETSGFLPGEAGAALLLEPAAAVAGRPVYGYLHGYWANSDAYHPLGVPVDGIGTAECLQKALAGLPNWRVAAICSHASGTIAHGKAERAALHAVFPTAYPPISVHLLKPFTGHSIGASGAVDMAIMLHYLRQGLTPPNLPGLSGAGAPFTMPEVATPVADDALILKISMGMGGHNAIVALSRAKAAL